MSTWVFLRGLTRESRHWGAFADIFRMEIPDAEIVSLDLPGNGSLHRMSSPTSVIEMADYCRAELARQGLMPPYNLLAMSLGAMVAVALASTGSMEISRCVLINTSMRPFSKFYRRLKVANYPALLKLMLFDGSAVEWESTILRLTSHRKDRQVELLDDWIRYRCEFPVSRRNMLRQLLAAARFRAPQTAPAARTLILASSEDALVDPCCSRELANHWQAHLVEHPGAGHDLPLDDGPWVAKQVHQWLATSSRAGKPATV